MTGPVIETIDNALAELRNWKHETRIATESESVTRKGGATEVLIIDTDPPGFLGKWARRGNPVTFGSDGVMKIDEDGLFRWLCDMSNIDLEDDARLAEIGADALSSAREVALNFFALRRVSSAAKTLSLDNGKPSTPSIQPTESLD